MIGNVGGRPTKLRLSRPALLALVNQGLTDRDIATRFGLHHKVILRARHKYGIPAVPRAAATRELPPPIATAIEEVEAFLARGGAITRCPPAHLVPHVSMRDGIF